MTHKVLAGSAEQDPNALRPLLDGQKHAVGSFGIGEVLASIRLRTFRGSGELGDILTISVEGFEMFPDMDIAELDLSTGMVFAERIDLLAMGVEPGSENPPAKLFIQSNRDLTDTKVDAIVEVERGTAVTN